MSANPAARVLASAAGLIATIGTLTLGCILAVVFAATLAVVAVLAVTLLGLAAFAWRFRRPTRAAAPVLEARKLGHSWVVYAWDQQG